VGQTREGVSIADHGASVEVAVGDLGTDDGAATVADAAADAFGGVDILINGAAGYVTRDWDETTAATWLDLYDQNVASIVRITQRLLPQMISTGWGRVIQLAGTTATMPGPTTAAYSATKAGVVNLTVSLAKSIAGSGVTANAISPSAVMTPRLETRICLLNRGFGGSGAEGI
jgi:3-oxoacyl-[acyl-carrier protein] reductase